jgi:hypothetical protein
MASDFDKDEIKDASFPIEFNDDSVSLDMFGVWVKNGPRDAQEATPASFDAFDDIPAETPAGISETITAVETDSFVDISDLPDFGDTAEKPAPETGLAESDTFELVSFPDITFEEIVTETSETVSEKNELPEEAESASFFSSASDISDIDLDTFLDESIESVKKESFVETESDDLAEPTLDGEPQEESTFTGFDEIDVIPFDDVATLNEPDETIAFVDEPVEEKSSVGEAEFETVTESFAAFDASLSSGNEYTLSEVPLISSISGLREAIEQEETAVDNDDAVTETITEAAEDDFSSFLDDLNSSSAQDIPKPTGSPDDLDLDDFINSVNESGTASKEEAEKVYADTDPVNIELEFDEDFIEDVQKIRATGASVSESEFFNSEFGVELIDETKGLSGTESFEDMFSSIPDSENIEQSGISAQESSSAIEETSEFDDLLSSLDLAPAPAVAKSEPQAAAPIKRKGYDLVVSDEGNDTISATVSETSVDDDIVVSLSGRESVVEHEKKTPVERPAIITEPEISLEPVNFTESGFETEPGIAVEPVRDVMSDIVSDLSIDEELVDFFVKDDSAAKNPEPLSAPAEENLDIPDIRDYNDTNSGIGADDSPNISMEDTVTLEFDDISAVEKELNDFVPDAGESQVVTNDKSTELLMIIADELSSIKKEISTLKSEIAVFKPQTSDQLVEGSPVAEHENSGFFTDDDTDETIALTGDELNNILITADFTEEKGPEGEEPQGEILSDTVGDEIGDSAAGIDTKTPEFTHLDFSVTEESSAEFASEAPEAGPDIGFSPIAAEAEPEIPDVLPDSILDVPEMDIPLAVDISHVTTIDEDTSYLEGSDVSDPDLDNVAIEEPELEIIDFEDEKLEEPELTEFNIDLTDISPEMPVEQNVSVPDELVAENAPFAESIPEVNEAAEESLAETGAPASTGVTTLPTDLKDEIKSVLSYMDQLLESLPEEKIEEFARSEHFEVYKKLFEELGIS